MGQFKDSAGRTWDLSVNVLTVTELKKESGINLCDVVEKGSKLLSTVLTDFPVMVEVAWGLCLQQAKEQQIDAREFARGMAGDTLGEIQDLLMKEIPNFFPPAQRKALQGLMELVQKTTEVVREKGMKAIEEADPELLAKSVIGSSLNTLESLASSPGPTPSDS